jgi:hypothetical protein
VPESTEEKEKKKNQVKNIELVIKVDLPGPTRKDINEMVEKEVRNEVKLFLEILLARLVDSFLMMNMTLGQNVCRRSPREGEN